MKELWFQVNHYFSQIWAGWPIKLPIAALGGFYTGYLGGDGRLVLAFLAMIVIDLLLGTWLAVRLRRFDVRLFGRWVLKVGTHFAVILIVGVAIRAVLEPMGIKFPLLDLFLGLLICTEALSIVKNMGRLGLPVPRLATKILTNIQQAGDRKAAEFFSQPQNDRRRRPRPEAEAVPCPEGKAYDELDPD